MQDINEGASPLPRNIQLRNTNSGIIGSKSEKTDKLQSDNIRLRKYAIE